MQNRYTQTFMPRVEFDGTISVFERAQTVHALDRALHDRQHNPIYSLY
jgi:hypothetical protein